MQRAQESVIVSGSTLVCSSLPAGVTSGVRTHCRPLKPVRLLVSWGHAPGLRGYSARDPDGTDATWAGRLCHQYRRFGVQFPGLSSTRNPGSHPPDQPKRCCAVEGFLCPHRDSSMADATATLHRSSPHLALSGSCPALFPQPPARLPTRAHWRWPLSAT